jgi:hypothetical protein
MALGPRHVRAGRDQDVHKEVSMKRMHSISSIAAAIALACAAPFALAQTTPESQHPQTGAMTHTPPYQTTPSNPANQQLPPRMPEPAQSSGMMGQHDMTGTVRSVSSKGIVEVHTDEGNLRVHFPDASQHLKKGDKITLHLSYSMASTGSM